jgi:uncharacterized protein (TIGR03067 family)
MRCLLSISVIILCFSCAGTKNGVVNYRKLNGTWLPVQQEMGGAILPASAFQTQVLVIRDSNYKFRAESVDKGIVKYQGNKMDIYGREGVNKGKHFTAIWKYENGQLTICYNLAGDSYPQAFETKSKPSLFISVFEKN